MSFFDLAWQALNSSDISEKKALVKEIENSFTSFDFKQGEMPKELANPSYAAFCDVYSLAELPKSKAPKNQVFLHSIAHIEYSAIDIALDACYRFRALPSQFYKDWLEVASDEIRHFELICTKLEKTGIKYGALPVHNGLFVALAKTAHSLKHRMALLPRHMEAGGLDANTNILNKIDANSELVPLLELIRDEEISHVSKGDKWFKYACTLDKSEPNEWLDIVLLYYPKAFANTKPIDKKRRKIAGFSEAEIAKIEQIMKNSQKG